MKIAIVGCGFVADFYMASVGYHQNLEICRVFDRDPFRLDEFSQYYSLPTYNSFDELVSDQSVELVLNLTNPREHYSVTRALLEAGKHVYSEKPLAMDYESARELVDLSKEKALYLGSAPCSFLSETAQTIWRALKDDVIGPVRLVYANFDAGMTHRYPLHKWRSASGALWPAKDEFEVGCTYEHAGYFLTWLAAYFGPARNVTAYASCQISDKGVPVDVITPDFSVGCIEYDNGIVARVTSSIVAPLDKSLVIMGDRGVIYTRDMRDDASPVYVSRTPPGRIGSALEYRLDYWGNKLERAINWIPWSWGTHWRVRKKYPYVIKPMIRSSGNYKPVDFCRGPAEMAEAIVGKRPARVSADLGLHITELIEVLQYPQRFAGQKKIKSAFSPIEPSFK
jgi:predicted dehydrogenase